MQEVESRYPRDYLIKLRCTEIRNTVMIKTINPDYHDEK